MTVADVASKWIDRPEGVLKLTELLLIPLNLW
jgi:hypothetical protein